MDNCASSRGFFIFPLFRSFREEETHGLDLLSASLN